MNSRFGIVIETASHDYDPNEYTNIYGVYASEEEAEQAKKKCEYTFMAVPVRAT